MAFGLIRYGVSPLCMAKPLVDEAIDQDLHRPPRGLQMLFYPAALPLSRQTLTCTAGVIRRHRKPSTAGSPWRKLNPGRQALLVLAYLRKGETFAELAAGFGVGHRHRLEVRHRDRGPAGRPVPEAAAGPGPGPGGRTRLPSHRRHLNSHRPGRGRPAVLFRQAPQARYEPAGHSHSGRGHRVGVRAAARRRARPDCGPDPGHPSCGSWPAAGW
jgi:hypothetical protein